MITVHISYRIFLRLVKVINALFRYGVANFFHNPKATADYWRRIASVALCQAQGKFRNSQNHSAGFMNLPQYKFDKILPSAEPIPLTLVEYQYISGDMPIHELAMLCKILRYRQPKVIFEIGTYLGGTTLQLAANSHAEVYTLDLPPSGHKDYVQPQIWNPELDVYSDQPGVRFHGSQYESRIRQLFGNSQTYDFTPYYDGVDFVFVDGCHHYEFVLRDSYNALKMMSSGGVVIWHDYASYAPGVIQALNELAKVVPLVHIAGTSLVLHQRSTCDAS